MFSGCHTLISRAQCTQKYCIQNCLILGIYVHPNLQVLLIQASCVVVHMTDMPVLLTVRQKAHIHEHKALALNFTSNRRVTNILCTGGWVSPRCGGVKIDTYYTASWTLLICFDIICSVHFKSIKLSIHDSNKRAFDTYQYNLTSLLHASESPVPSSESLKSRCRALWWWHKRCHKTCRNNVTLYLCISFVVSWMNNLIFSSSL